jgi:hypothetical protein
MILLWVENTTKFTLKEKFDIRSNSNDMACSDEVLNYFPVKN